MTDRSDTRSQAGREDHPRPRGSPFVAAIREVADRQGLSLATVSERAGLGDLLAEVEAGHADEEEVLSLDHFVAVARVLDVSASKLFISGERLCREQPDR